MTTEDETTTTLLDATPLPLQGPLAALDRVPEVSLLGYDNQLDGVEGRIIFRAWVRPEPPAATLDADALPEQQTPWFRDLLSKLGIVDHCFISIGPERNWVEARLAEGGLDGRWIVSLLDAQRGNVIDVFVLHPNKDAVLRVWRRKGEFVAHLFRGLRAKYHTRALTNAQSHSEASAKRWSELRQTLSAIASLSWSEETTTEGPMPPPKALHEELSRGELPMAHKLRDQDRNALLRWLTDIFRVRARTGTFWLDAGFERWWRIAVPDLEPLFQAIFEHRPTTDVLLLSEAPKRAFGWLVEENHVVAFDYAVDMLLDRRASRQRLEALLDRTGIVHRQDVQGIGSRERVEHIFRQRCRFSTLNRSVSSSARDHWLTRIFHDKLSPGLADSPDEQGRVELSLGQMGLISWIPVRYQNDDWLAELWRTGALDALCIRTIHDRRILGIRTTTKTYEAFFYRYEPRRRRS